MSPQQDTQLHLCDFCSESQALLYCRADTAKLCFSCDRHVHSANALSGKHTRSHLCNSCSSAPASIRCSTEDLLLCQSCDWESHGSGSVQSSFNHDRRPLEGFSGCPTPRELASLLGFDLNEKSSISQEVGSDGFLPRSWEKEMMDHVGDDGLDSILYGPWAWETPVASLNDSIVPSGNYISSCHSVPNVEVPFMNKQRHIACGRYKEEIIKQLLDIVKSETRQNDDHGVPGSVFDIQSPSFDKNLALGIMRGPAAESNDNGGSTLEDKNLHRNLEVALIAVPNIEDSMIGSARRWCIDDYPEAIDPVGISYKHSAGSTTDEVPVRSTDVNSCEIHVNDESMDQMHVAAGENVRIPLKREYELPSHDRDSSLLRYKEKKKTRRYDRHIRYESRQARAHSRTRIKGRFAKVNHVQNLGFGGDQV